jgi:hypothetical protein
MKITLDKVIKHDGDLNIQIELSETFDFSNDKQKYYEDNKNSLYVNELLDWKKYKYYPIHNEKIIYRIYKQDDSNLNYSDLGFTSDSIKLQYNSFKKSKFRINYYDSNIVTNRSLIMQNDFDFKLIPEIHYSNGELMPVQDLDVVFETNNPIENFYNDKFTEHYYLYYFDIGDEKNVYLEFTLLNALDGKQYNLTPNETSLLTYKKIGENYYYIAPNGYSLKINL